MSLFDGLDQYIAQARPRFEEWLGRLVEIPTVSMDPARRNDMRRGAEVAVGCLTALGAQATIVETGGHPLVVGGWMRDPAWPTVRSEEHTSELQSRRDLVCRLLLEKKKQTLPASPSPTAANKSSTTT